VQQNQILTKESISYVRWADSGTIDRCIKYSHWAQRGDTALYHTQWRQRKRWYHRCRAADMPGYLCPHRELLDSISHTHKHRETRKSMQSCRHACHAGTAFDNRVTLTLWPFTSELMDAERLYVC